MLFIFQNYGERERGKVVVYTTSMGVVRTTYQRCLQVQRILGTLLINYEERDVSMNRQEQNELKERTKSKRVSVPQVFVEGQFLGVSLSLCSCSNNSPLALIVCKSATATTAGLNGRRTRKWRPTANSVKGFPTANDARSNCSVYDTTVR